PAFDRRSRQVHAGSDLGEGRPGVGGEHGQHGPVGGIERRVGFLVHGCHDLMQRPEFTVIYCVLRQIMPTLLFGRRASVWNVPVITEISPPSSTVPSATVPSSTEVLERVQARVLWLATSMVHHANHVR